MFNTSQVILRNDRHFIVAESQSTFVLNPPADQLLSGLKMQGPVLVWDFPAYQSLLGQRVPDVYFAPEISADSVCSQALIFMPKSQAEFGFLWKIACAHVNPGSAIFLVGEKREGIGSAAKRLEDQGIRLTKLDSARHCQLWRVESSPAIASPKLDDYYQAFQLDSPTGPLRIFSLPGVFGVGRLDEGTKLLLDNLGDVPSGRLLDFGCGSGVIGTYLKSTRPKAEVHLVDIHALALESAARTLAENRLEAKVYASDGLAQVEGGFRAIYTNPPFHAGVKTDYRVTTQMIRDAREHLDKGGELRLVANAFLHYPELIESVFGNCEILAQTTKFKVYRAVRT